VVSFFLVIYFLFVVFVGARLLFFLVLSELLDGFLVYYCCAFDCSAVFVSCAVLRLLCWLTYKMSGNIDPSRFFWLYLTPEY